LVNKPPFEYASTTRLILSAATQGRYLERAAVVCLTWRLLVIAPGGAAPPGSGCQHGMMSAAVSEREVHYARVLCIAVAQEVTAYVRRVFSWSLSWVGQTWLLFGKSSVFS
jgi:hypothetical protein